MKKQTELATKIQKLYANGTGMSYRQIEKELGCSRSLISYHLRKRTRDLVRKSQQERREHLTQKLWDYKKERSCSLCSESHPATLQFHHKDKEEKLFSISYMINTKKMAWDRILDEIEKCVLLCANCHLKLHYEQDHRRVKKLV